MECRRRGDRRSEGSARRGRSRQLISHVTVVGGMTLSHQLGVPSSNRVLDALEGQFGSASALQATDRELQAMLRDRGISFGDGLLPTYAFAFLAPQDQIARWATQAELLIRVAEHMAQR